MYIIKIIQSHIHMYDLIKPFTTYYLIDNKGSKIIKITHSQTA